MPPKKAAKKAPVKRAKSVDTKTTKKAPVKRANSKDAKTAKKAPVKRANSKDTKTTKKPISKAKSKSIKEEKKTKKEPVKRQASKESVKTGVKRKASQDLEEKKPIKKQKSSLKENIVTVITKGGAPVDEFVPQKATYSVLNKGGKIYSATLNQSNLDANNNKFYMIQILFKDGKPDTCWTWNRWGRVGVPGQNALKGPFSPEVAISDFQKKYHAKAVAGNYQELEINYDDDKAEEAPKKQTVKKQKSIKKPCKLDKRVQNFVNLIFDKDMINTSMKQIGYDAKKCPLGKLGDGTIKQAYEALAAISEAIKAGRKQDLNKLSSQFFTLIPHDFGFQKMANFVIDTEQKMQDKNDMLKSLTDLKITTKLLSQADVEELERVQQNYNSLNCTIKSVDKNEKAYKLIETFVQDSGNKAEIVDVFEISRPGEKERYTTKVGNDQLLWHGTKVCNYTGILSQGLRIAPPEAPHNGYAYGKGIYFANNFNTSDAYCSGPGKTRCIILCQGALGKIGYFQGHNKYLLPGFDSSIGFSRVFLPDNAYEEYEGLKVPTKSGKLAHNANIVYDVKQAQIKYVIRYNSQYGY